MSNGKASSIRISTKEDTNNLYLTIVDKGIGFDTKHHKNTLGLIGLRERAISVNGKVQIESTIGKGTVISVVVPKK